MQVTSTPLILLSTVASTAVLMVPMEGRTSWPQFRGPSGQGHSSARKVPLSWSETENVAWKAAISGKGWSSPVVVDHQVWVTTATDGGSVLHAICLDSQSGEQRMDVRVFEKNQPKKVHGKNSHASPTPFVDGNRLYVHFGTYGTACLNRATGEVLWRRKLNYNPFHGPGGSPVVFDELLIVNCDGSDQQFVVALNKRTGAEVWRTRRAHISQRRKSGEAMPGMAFSSPLVTKDRGTDVALSAGADHLAAYDARTGKEIWWFEYFGYSVVPRPIVTHGLTFAATSYDKALLHAIRLGGEGNVTETHAAWSLERGAPKNPSVLAVDDELYVVSDDGIATCLDIETGEQHWRKRLGGNFSASPLFADGRVYFTDESGKTTVVAPGRKYQQLAENQIDGQTLASLAPIDGAIFLRSSTHLYRIEVTR